MLNIGQKVIDGDMNIGDFVAVNAYVVSMFAPLSFLGSIYNAIVQALTDVKHFLDLMTEEPDIVDELHAVPIPLPGITYLTEQGGVSGRKGAEMCTGCQRVAVLSDWLFCPICGTAVLGTGQHQALVTARHHVSDIEAPGEDTMALSTLVSRGEETNDSSSGSNSSSRGVDIEFENVYFHYPTQLQEKGLQAVSFYVPPGTTTAIVGHSGSCKTTISRLLYRFYDPLRGHVKIGGYDVKHYTQKSVRNAIGIVPQDCVLFNDTIYYNIQYGRQEATREEVLAAAEAAQIREFVEALPDGWETKVGERGLKLSGGEKQRVAIARCFLKDPPILVFDEATSALDTITEESVQEALYLLGRHRTVVVIAHRLSTIKNADQILVMSEGVVLEKGTHSELVSKPAGHYAKLWERQFQQEEEVGEQVEGELEAEQIEVVLASSDTDTKP